MSMTRSTSEQVGEGHPFIRRTWRRGLHRARRRFWNWHPELRHACFVKAIDVMTRYDPEWVVANGDYGGDWGGVGLSDEHTFESVAGVIQRLRRAFPGRCRFVFGDHELGKYSTERREGGIRLASLTHGEDRLGIRSFWHERHGRFHLIGINSTLFTLELFLPEALESEIGLWMEYRRQHLDEVRDAFRRLPGDARVLIFCHDPSALSILHEVPEVRARLPQIERTVLGHLHAPRLLHAARWLSRLPRLSPRYPVARIIAQGVRGARHWKAFRPAVCPSTFGAGQHFAGGLLFLQTDEGGRLHVRRRRLAC
jgi:hypothetical protein